MKNNEEFIKIAEELKNKPIEENWKRIEKAIKNSNAYYYKIRYVKLNNSDDLRKSYAEIFDKNKKLIIKIPIFKKIKNKIEGGTIYLKDLYILNE